MNFSDKILEKTEKLSAICVGIDPVLEKIPEFIKKAAIEEVGENLEAVEIALTEFGCGIIDSMEGLSGILKPNLAYFEQYGSFGIKAFEEICKYAKEKDILVIADGKRNDIGATSQAYSNAFLGKTDVFGKKIQVNSTDALTVNPYLGVDGIAPFAKDCIQHGKGIFILVKTSNPSSVEFQDLPIGEEVVCEEIARKVADWGMADLGEKYFSSIGAVVGATYPDEASYLRSLMPNQIFLVPGYGAQGGNLESIRACFNRDKLGAIINSTRGINYNYLNDKKYSDENFIEATRDAIVLMKDDLDKI